MNKEDIARQNVELAARSVVCSLEKPLFLLAESAPVRREAELKLEDHDGLVNQIYARATRFAHIPRSKKGSEEQYTSQVSAAMCVFSSEQIFTWIEIYLKRFGY